MSSRAHTQALVAYLKAEPKLANIVFDGNVPGTAPVEYVLVFPQSLDHGVDRFAGRQRGVSSRHTIHCVSKSPAAAQHLADRVSARLVGARLTVGGIAQGRIAHVAADPLRLDTDVYFLADDYEWGVTP